LKESRRIDHEISFFVVCNRPVSVCELLSINKPGTAFEDLPYDWVCPLCGAKKEHFEKID